MLPAFLLGLHEGFQALRKCVLYATRVKKLFLLLLSIFAAALSQPEPPFPLASEWEPSFGTFIRWPLGIPADLVVELASDDSLYVLVANWAQQAEAMAVSASWGVNTGNCRFIEIPAYSHWTRDWGPHLGFDGSGGSGIIDPVFDGFRADLNGITHWG